MLPGGFVSKYGEAAIDAVGLIATGARRMQPMPGLLKRYAVDAVLLLSGRTALADDPRQLWQLVIGGAPKVENAQMDVVVALWKRGLIV
jgi:hypothetical protein